MAPEQAAGATVDGRCDLFSLGCVLYRLVTGKLPFHGGDTIATLVAVATENPRPPKELRPETPPELSALVMRLLAKKPEGRPASAQEVVAALAVIEGAHAAGTAAKRPVPKKPAAAARWPLLLGAAGVLLAVCLASGLIVGISALMRPADQGSPQGAGRDRKRPVGPGQVGNASPFDKLHREDIPLDKLKAAGQGDPKKAPAEIVAILGESQPKLDANAIHMALSPDGKTLALASWNNDTVTFWGVETRKERLFADKVGHVKGMRFSHDGKILAIQTRDRDTLLWSVDTGKPFQTLFKGDRGWPIGFSADDRVVYYLENQMPKAANVKGRVPAGTPEPPSFESPVKPHLATLSQEGSRLALSGLGFVRLWDTRTGKFLRSVRENNPLVTVLTFSPDGQRLFLSCGYNWGGTIAADDTATGKSLGAFNMKKPPSSIAVRPDGNLVASSNGEGDVYLWDPEFFRKDRLLRLNLPFSGGVREVLFTPDGRHLLTRNSDGTVYVLRLADQGESPGAGVGRKKPDPRDDPPLIPTGDPLTPLTLVTRPAPLKGKGVASWTIDTKRHRGAAPVSVFCPDNQRVASAGDDGTVRIWERGTGKLLRILIDHTAPVQVVAWSPDGKRLASAGDDYSVRIWDPNQGLLLKKLTGHERRILALAWSPDGKVLASGGDDYTVRLWEMPSGQDRRIFRGHNGPVWAITWDKTGQRLLSANGSRFIHWEKTEGKILDEIKDAKFWAWPDGNDTLVYVKHKGDDVHFLEFATGKSRSLPVPVLQDGRVGWCLALSADGKTLATRGKGGVTFWDARTGKFLGTGASPNYTALTFSPDGKYLAGMADHDYGIDLWSVDKADKIRKLPGPLWCGGARFSSDSKYVCGSMGADQITTIFWDVPDGKSWHIGLIWPECGAAAWSPDGRRLAASRRLFRFREVTVWDLNTFTLKHFLPGAFEKADAVAWSRDGKLLARLGDGIELWSPPAPKPLRILQAKEARGFVLSPQSDLLAAFPSHSLWDVATGAPVRSLDSLGKPFGVVVDAAWSPDGKTLATINRDWNGVDLWDIDTGKHRGERLERHQAGPRALAWSPDGKTLASGGADQTVCLWSHTGKFLTQLKDPQQTSVTALAWLPAGKTLAALSDNGTLCLWDTSADKLVRAHKGLDAEGRFCPDGKLLASLNTFAGIRLWDTATGQPRGVLVFIEPQSPNQYLVVTPEGHYRGDPPRMIDREIVYVVQTAQGQEMLTPGEFASKYQWKNEPDRVSQLLK
jgi:WD40 repeat protein